MSAVGQNIFSDNEAARLAAVKRYDILDTPADGEFDRITAIAARRFKVPIAIISIVDEDRIWFKSHHGIAVSEIGRDPGLCASAILKNVPHVLTDAKKDARALTNPLVADEFGLRFYAGVPLQTRDGHNLGTLCVIDKRPRTITQDEIDELSDLAAVVMDQLEFRLEAQKALAQARLLSQEIDHRVMNSLSFISSLLQMQQREAATPEMAEQLEEAASRVAAVARVHRHFHLDPDVENTPALPYLRALSEDMSCFLEIPITVEGDDGLLPMTAIQSIGLILNELASNAAKRQARHITVAFSRAKMCKLMVSDDGKGAPPDISASVKTGRLGMKIVSVLARQLGGELTSSENPNGQGACFTVTFNV